MFILILFCFFCSYRTSPKDDEQRHTIELSTNIRDPFALQPSSKNSHHQLPPTNSDKNWQTIVQQQYNLSNTYSTQFPSRSSRPSGSTTQGNPVSSSSVRLTNEQQQQQYTPASNNQLFNPRYGHYMNKSKKDRF